MKGRVVALGHYQARAAAALIVDGIVDDLLVDPPAGQPLPGTIFRAVAERPLKGQGGMIVRLPAGNGFLRGAKGLKGGQALLAQVTGFAESGKAIPLTERVIFKGRSAIVTPGAPGLNISRRIKDDDTRLRLHDLVEGEAGHGQFGVILRSFAAQLPDDEIEQELRALTELADQVMGDSGNGPECLVDGPTAHELAWREWCDPAPDAIEKGDGAFEHFGVTEAIEDAQGAHIALAAGGGMFVEPTRALVAVDVNTGSDVSPGAALKVNLAAAKMLPRALRLRGLGGQITLDFAPLSKKDRRQIEHTLRAAFKADTVDTALIGWTPLGHFELQRKRERYPLGDG